jgi:hypothetical protein
MRAILLLCGLTLLLGVGSAWHAMQIPTRYGDFTGAPPVSVNELLDRPQDFLGKTVSVHGTVSDQCKATGCFFYLPSPSGRLRIELEEIAMNVPAREGRPVRVEGQLIPYGKEYRLYASAVDFH